MIALIMTVGPSSQLLIEVRDPKLSTILIFYNYSTGPVCSHNRKSMLVSSTKRLLLQTAFFYNVWYHAVSLLKFGTLCKLIAFPHMHVFFSTYDFVLSMKQM